jgi:hypothetical protein
MKWVTWENIAVDRMGCAWLIRRFIDPEAEFVFIPAGQSPDLHDPQAFDIPGVRLSHRRGHCTFHTLLTEYHLENPVLNRIAAIIDEADVVQESLVEPAAIGLDIICRGIRRISPDDLTALERSELIYEALYAQLAAETI